MSAILHKFKIKLTAAQAMEIRSEWKKFEGRERAMLAVQPIGMTLPDGFIDSREPHLQCAIMDDELTGAVNLAIRSAMEAMARGGNIGRVQTP